MSQIISITKDQSVSIVFSITDVSKNACLIINILKTIYHIKKKKRRLVLDILNMMGKIKHLYSIKTLIFVGEDVQV